MVPNIWDIPLENASPDSRSIRHAEPLFDDLSSST